MSDEFEEPEQQDVQDHPATLGLKEMLKSGTISQETYENLSFKFNKLHQAFIQSCSTEQILLRRTRELNKELKSQKLTIQNSATQQQEHRQSLTLLRQLVTNLQAELETTQQQIETTQQNTQMKKREVEKLEIKVEQATEDQKIKLEPQKNAIVNENQEIEREIEQKRNTIKELRDYNAEMIEKIAIAEEKIAELEKKKKAENQRCLEISANPIKLKQKSNAAEALHNTLLTEEKNIVTQLQSLDQQYQTLYLQVHNFEGDYQHISNDIEGMLSAFYELKKKATDLEGKCDEQKQIKLVRENEKKRVLKQIDEKAFETANLLSKVDSIQKDIARKEKEVLKLEEAISRQIMDEKALESQLQTVHGDKQNEINRLKQLNKELNRTIEEKEKALQQLVATEALHAETLEQLQIARSEKDRKQMIHDTLAKKELDFIQQLSEASLIRDRKAREMASMKKKTSDIRQQAKERNLDYLDLVRKQELIMINMNETSKLYEQVKLERNRHVSTIQTSRQLIVELNEKIRILDSETKVLRKEFELTDAQVRVQANELNQAFTRRDATKSELKKAQLYYQELEAKIDFQANETERLNIVLHNIEDQIESQQGRYAEHSEDYAKRQRMLIDKQDNLCMLLEQFNKHEEVMKNGEIEMKKREEEIKYLNLQLQNFKRQIDLMNRKIPQLKAYNKEIQELKLQIAKEQKGVDEITRKLEVPSEQERKRSYCGRDFTLAELEEKVSHYEQRVHAKERELWEKKILLAETIEKIQKIESSSESNIAKCQSMIQRTGQLRANSMALKRKQKAGKAELSIYQAMKDDLIEQHKEVKNEIEEAMRRSSRGEAFDEKADKLIRMHERDYRVRTLRNSQYANLDDDDEEEIRPGREHYDAYPTKDGLSRPYGAFPVFQPAKPSANLRHYRNETDRPIQL